MLNLSVSVHPCLPGRKQQPSTSVRPVDCQICGAPGGANGSLLDEHIVSKGKSIFICPICHMCLHLDAAGRQKAGKIIWLPEMSQEQLNILCLAMFVAVGKSGVLRGNDAAKGVLIASKRLYEAFDKRSESIESFLGGSAGVASGQKDKAPLMSRQSLSSPLHLASLLVRVKREAKLSARDLAARIDGMRLLPSPKAFDAYISQVSKIATNEYPVHTWGVHAAKATAVANAALEKEPVTHFNAETIS